MRCVSCSRLARSRAGHCVQRADYPHRLGHLPRTAQEDANRPQDWTRSGPPRRSVLVLTISGCVQKLSTDLYQIDVHVRKDLLFRM